MVQVTVLRTLPQGREEVTPLLVKCESVECIFDVISVLDIMESRVTGQCALGGNQRLIRRDLREPYHLPTVSKTPTALILISAFVSGFLNLVVSA